MVDTHKKLINEHLWFQCLEKFKIIEIINNPIQKLSPLFEFNFSNINKSIQNKFNKELEHNKSTQKTKFTLLSLSS